MKHPMRKFLSTATFFMALSANVLYAPWALAEDRGESRIDAGDVVEISVAGVPELRQRATVNLDGEISLPLIGAVKVIGLPLSQIRAKVKELAVNKVFRQRTPDGRENLVAIWPDEVTVDVVEYRPVYLSGDVSRPGEQRYRPGMTIRQAVALAGGYDIMRFRVDNPATQSADLRAEYQTLWTEFAQEEARARRIQAELDGKPALDTNLSDIPVPSSVATQIAQVEAAQLSARDADQRNARAHLQRMLEMAGNQLTVLLDQQQRGEDGAKSDAVDLESVTELHKKGMVPMTRVLEAKRSLLWSSTSFLQSVAQVSQLNRDREDIKRRLEQLDDQRRMDLLREQQATTVRIATLRARLQAVGEKLLYTAAVKSQLVRGNGGKPELTIFRKGDAGWQRIPADEDTEMAPGDTVEVVLRSELVAGLPSPLPMQR